MTFASSRLKIDRAAYHADTLKQQFEEYRKSDPIRVTVWIADDPSYVNWKLEDVRPIPIEWAVIVGDIVHNLRVSLDLLASDLVSLNKADVDGVYFPFASKADDLDMMIKKRRLDGAIPEAVELIRSLKPYTGGNDILRGVHDLDISDKHRAIVPVAGRIQIGGIGIGYLPNPNNPKTPGGYGMQLRKAAEKRGLEIGERLPASFELVFPHNMPFAELDMSETFDRLLQYFSRVLDAFDVVAQGRKPDLDTIKF